MRPNWILAVLTVIVSVFTLATAATARDGSWKTIGRESVRTTTVEVDKFETTSGRLKYSRLRIKAIKNGVYVRRVVVTFGNNKKQIFDVDELIDQGGYSSMLDLIGRERRIKNVQIEYISRKSGRTSSIITVEAFGKLRRSAPQPRPRDLSIVGETTLRRGWEQTVIPVERGTGPITKFAIHTTNYPVRIRDIIVSFANGRTKRIDVDRHLIGGERTQIFTFTKPRRVKKVEVRVRAVVRRRLPTLQLLATPARFDRYREPAAKPPKWVLLGTRKASMFNKDTDVFNVGRQAGRFSKIRVTAKKHDIRMYGMNIIYGNGNNESVPLYGTLQDGRTSSPFDLKGRHRFIDRIVFKYRTKLNFKGSGRIELWGLKVP